MRRSILLSLCLLLLVTTCSVPPSAPVLISITSTVPPTDTTTPLSPTPPPIPARTKYTLNATVDYDHHSVLVYEVILFPNQSGEELDRLVLAVAANFWPNCFRLDALNVNGIPVTDYTLTAHRLDVALPAPLAPDSVSTLTLSYSLTLPYLDQIHSLRARIFGYGDIQMNLVNWYPFIAPNINGEWIIREPWSHGEYLVYPIADFEVDLKFTQPENAPIVASSGYAEPNGEFTRYTLSEARTFAISASRDFHVSNMQAGDTTVYSYYLPIYKNAGEAAMTASAQALQLFSQKFGPYPHKTLSVVMADFKDSMEFSGLFFHSRSFYDLYDGTPESYLVAVAAHETGHQWWFEQVANDQAEEPWLDESLTTYSEAIFYEALYPDSLAWWWSYRIDFFKPFGKIDIPVNEGQNADTYKYIVYFNGAHFLRDLRGRIGDEAFFSFLRDYLAQERDRIATKADFFRVLDEHTQVDYSDIVTTYFRSR